MYFFFTSYYLDGGRVGPTTNSFMIFLPGSDQLLSNFVIFFRRFWTTKALPGGRRQTLVVKTTRILGFFNWSLPLQHLKSYLLHLQSYLVKGAKGCKNNHWIHEHAHASLRHPTPPHFPTVSALGYFFPRRFWII